MPGALALTALLTAQAPVPLTAGLELTRSARVVPGQYLRLSRDDQPALVIRGDNITVDFQNATLLGSPITTEPDQRKGIGILVEGKNVVLRNVRVRGYKVGILVRNSPGFMLLDSDLSHNWKQRLRSTVEREDQSDWMSFHKNENDEWLRYGAGVYITGSDRFKLRDVRIQGGQCGAMITRSNKGLVVNCDFSFLSGVGLGLYRSSDNRVMHNKMDWCVRGYSHGRYNRGQDSAGILVYEQSSRNIFAYNSATHSGDGFFLWAGQSTMDTGEGGSNDNLLYGNDFSHAPTNGIEATFSRNTFANNLIQECWHGVWGGYSYESQIVGNQFALNATAIAIEHGQCNRISYNRFQRDLEGVQLWERPTQPADWPYAQKRDVRSRDNEIRGNVFEDTVAQALDVRGSVGLRVWQNQFRAVGRVLNPEPQVESMRFFQNVMRMARHESSADLEALAPRETGANRNTVNIQSTARPSQALMRPDGNVRVELEGATRDYLRRFRTDWNPLRGPVSPFVRRFWVTPEQGGVNPFLKGGTLRGRRYILVNEWGPYDFKSPILWPREERWEDGRRVVRFEVLGPFGRWRVRQLRGLTLSAQSGQVPGFVEARFAESGGPDLRVDLEYRGRRVTDHRGVTFAAGSLVPFGWREFRVPIRWNVRFWPYDKESEDPRTQSEAFAAVLQRPAAFTENRSELNYDFWAEPYPNGPRDHFASVAEGSFSVPTGEYELEVSADDGVRLFVDDQLVVDEWKFSPPVTHTRRLRLGGRHRVRIEHFELDGFAQLKFNIRLPD